MADAPAPPRSGGGPVAVLTKKVGPLPLFVWVLAGVLAFYLYRRSHPSSPTAPSSTTPTDQNTYVPGFDAGTSGGGGIGSSGTPGGVSTQPPVTPPDGGGTSTGGDGRTTTGAWVPNPGGTTSLWTTNPSASTGFGDPYGSRSSAVSPIGGIITPFVAS